MNKGLLVNESTFREDRFPKKITFKNQSSFDIFHCSCF